MPPTDELRGWSRLIAGVADQVVVGTVQDMHRAISDGVYRWIGPPGRPVKMVQDAVTERIYGAVRASLRAAGELGVVVADQLAPDEVRSPTPRSDKARAIAHGVVGDDLIALAPELDLDLAVRLHGAEVVTEPSVLRDAYPDASSRVVVFVHGLVDTEAVWFSRPDAGVALPDVVAGLGATPVLVRYGTGRSIGRSGVELADVLDELVENWPVPVTELILVGHSMGGLVIRSASAHAQEHGQDWVAALTDIVYLGTPHVGSWLEKVANSGSWVLRRVSTRSAPIGTLLDGRSRGIKDLRFGMLTDDGYGDASIDDLLTGRVPPVPWVADVTHHLVVGRLRTSDRHPLTFIFGDALVRTRSASGIARRGAITGDAVVNVVPVDARHTHLVRAPQVADLLGGMLRTD